MAKLEVHLIADFGISGVPGAIAPADAGGEAMSRLGICMIASLSMGLTISQGSISIDEMASRTARIGSLPTWRLPTGVCDSDADCDDGDFCTIGTCVEHTCVQEDIIPCCGNGVIEDGEQCDPPDGVTCDADCQLILCGPDEGCCCCPGEGCSAIDPVLCADMGCTPVEECLGDSNEDGEDDACVDACCLGDGSCKPLSEDECAGMEGTSVQACVGDQDGDGRDDACPCQIDADCDDGNPCTLNICDPTSGMCLAEFAPESTPCEIDGELCSLEHCDGEGSCVPFGEVVCEEACPACEGECDPETGLCPCAGAKVDGDWSDDIWNLEGPNPYPDNNTGVPGLGAVIQGLIDVFLDVTVEIESLCLLDGGILRVTAGGTVGPTGDITVIGPKGILIEGTLYVADSHVIDASAGPVTIGANGKYLADPDAVGDVDTVLIADELTMLEAPVPAEPGFMEVSDSMQAGTAGHFLLDGTNFSDKGDCTPPDLSVIDSGRIEVGGNFIILNAAQVGYSSSVSMSLEGNFDNGSKFPMLFDWTAGGVLLTGAGAPTQTVEAGGEDRGRCATGFIDNFAFGTLEVQSGATVSVVDVIDNQGDGDTACDEALYVNTLIVNSGAELNTGGCRVYYRELTNNGTIPGLGVDVLEIERADFNGDCFVGAEDLAILLGNWGPCPDPCPPFCLADLSDDCAVDAFDLALLLGKWGPVN